MNHKVKLEYVWLDGYTPEPNLRSKVKVIDIDENHRIGLNDCPMWSFDGSSTRQAEGHYSDRVLKPVKVYKNPFQHGDYHFFVLCEVWNPDGTPHESNVRHLLRDHDQIWYDFVAKVDTKHFFCWIWRFHKGFDGSTTKIRSNHLNRFNGPDNLNQSQPKIIIAPSIKEFCFYECFG